MQKLQVIEQDGIRVLTTPQLAECYGCDRKTISYNFQYNKKRYIRGKHYIDLKSEELRRFKNRLDIQDSLKHANTLYLWTEKGALLHAKSLNTDKAWEVYDYLVDFYFRAKEVTSAVTPSVAQPLAPPVELSEWEKRIIAYNRGVVLGVYRAEMTRREVDALAVYNLLSSQGKETVASLLLGEGKL